MANIFATHSCRISKCTTLRNFAGFVLFTTAIILLASVYRYQGNIVVGRPMVKRDGGHQIPNMSNKQLQFTARDKSRQLDPLNCSVSLIKTEKDLHGYRDYLHKSKQPDICTIGYFKDSFVKSGHFYDRGAWYAPANGRPSTEVEFLLDDCSFPTDLMTRIHQCVHAKDVKRILVTGDSNARKTALSLISLLNTTDNETGDKCKKIQDSIISKRSYFAVEEVPEKMLKIQDCGFGGIACSSSQYECFVQRDSHEISKSVTIEYLPMLHILDGSLHIGEIVRQPEYRLLAADTKIEYLLKYYFPSKGFPDIWLYKPPFLHDTWRNSIHKSAADMQYLLMLFDIYLPNTTNLIFMSASPECRKKRPSDFTQVFESKWNISRNERLHEHNTLWATLLRPIVAARKNYYVMFDEGQLTCPIMCDWHVDGAHLNTVWYDRIVEYTLAAYCLE